MKRISILANTVVLCAALSADAALAADIHTTPPANFKKVSTLVKLPDYVPGLGTLYVDPSTLPVGPYLGYNDGMLVNITYMVPLKQIDEEHKSFNNLGTAAKGVKIDHTDMNFNPGHPGVEEPHYHIIEWIISKSEQDSQMK